MQINHEKILREAPKARKDIYDMSTKISAYGDWDRLEGTAVIIQRVINQLLIKKGTYLFDPEFGEDLLQFLFEPADGSTLSQIDKVVAEVVAQNRGDTNMSHEVLWFRNKKGFRINISITTEGKIKNVPIDIDESLLREAA